MLRYPEHTLGGTSGRSAITVTHLWVDTPTVSLDVIALEAGSCGYYRRQIDPYAAQSFTGHVATQRVRATSTIPPSAARSARCAQARASLQTSTAAPEAWHRAGTLSRAGTPRWRTQEEQRLHRLPMPPDALPARLASFRLLAMASPPLEARRKLLI